MLSAFIEEPTGGTAPAEAGEGWELFPENHARTLEEQEAADEPWLVAGWARLRGEWSDPAAHRRLLGEAAGRNSFAGLGQRYRDHLLRHPDDQVAIDARDELLRKATTQLFTQLPRESPRKVQLARNLILLLFLLGAVGFGAWMVFSLGVLS